MNQLLTGLILESKKTKVYKHWPNCSPPNCQPGCRWSQYFYKLKVKLEHEPISTISVFADKLVQPDKILPILTQQKFLDKRYCFTCINYFSNYHLVDLKELGSISTNKKISHAKET